MTHSENSNLHGPTVRGFGEEWQAFDQDALDADELERGFDAYFGLLSLDGLGEGFDFGCGSGRWAELVAPRVRELHCIDASPAALTVARAKLQDHANVHFHEAGADDLPLAEGSQDFGYSLGVLHHIPDTAAALSACVTKLKPGAPFLVYLYYKFDNRPAWFRLMWRGTDSARRGIARLPFGVKRRVTDLIALTTYWPLARASALLEWVGANVAAIPLSFYRDRSFYTMRTDALDRFGTRLEQRFTRGEIEAMMRASGLTEIRFSEREPYWVACGIKA